MSTIRNRKLVSFICKIDSILTFTATRLDSRVSVPASSKNLNISLCNSVCPLGYNVFCYSRGFTMSWIQHHDLDFCYCQQHLYAIGQTVWNIKSDSWNGLLEQVTDWINTEHEKLRYSSLFSSFKVEAFRVCLECDSWLHHFFFFFQMLRNLFFPESLTVSP